jgi:hypothetical protein
MYVVRRKHSNGVSFKTYDGWTHCSSRPKDVLDLNEVMRFTEGERDMIVLAHNEEWVYFGCYKELKDD